SAARRVRRGSRSDGSPCGDLGSPLVEDLSPETYAVRPWLRSVRGLARPLANLRGTDDLRHPDLLGGSAETHPTARCHAVHGCAPPSSPDDAPSSPDDAAPPLSLPLRAPTRGQGGSRRGGAAGRDLRCSHSER